MQKSFSETVKKYYSLGQIAEQVFASDLVKSEGGDIIKPTQDEDINDHIDRFWEKDGKTCSFDVKGARKKSRQDNTVSYDTTWLEFKNVHGNNGSLLGRQNYIVFEMENKWAIVRRKQLLSAVTERIVDKTVYNQNPNENFKLYQRSGRKDLITRVPFSFIEENTVKYIMKNN